MTIENQTFSKKDNQYYNIYILQIYN